ncbi:MAG: Gfo/Idh/MocA family oxidoreductase [Oscillospiraceae bacterium]|nr:Gfo/Idh/MocA family oxidoreductase [Oscillospiraceae bacterium]
MTIRIGIIGCGNRMTDVWRTAGPWKDEMKLVAVADPNRPYAEGHLRAKGLWEDDIRFYGTAEEMLEKEELDGVMIGTRCNLHTKYAVMVMERGLPLFLEKPVSTTDEELNALKAAAEKRTAPVLVSFPLRAANIAREARAIVESGALGQISTIQCINNVPYGRVYYKRWSRDDSITGGLWLQKATHDLDAIFFLVEGLPGFKPAEICAMESKVVFKGDKPAGLHCSECPERRTCPDSIWVINNKYSEATAPGDACSFAVDTGNHDTGSALVRFENGVHAAYSQNFVARKEAAVRMVRVIGFKATLEFDFHSGELKVFHHQRGETEVHRFTAGSGHYGGDFNLMDDFYKMITEGTEPCAGIEAGLTSALACLRARQSCEERSYRAVEYAD